MVPRGGELVQITSSKKKRRRARVGHVLAAHKTREDKENKENKENTDEDGAGSGGERIACLGLKHRNLQSWVVRTALYTIRCVALRLTTAATAQVTSRKKETCRAGLYERAFTP